MNSDNIVQKPIIRSGIDKGSRVSVCIDLFCKDKEGKNSKVGSGTGFFHERRGEQFLITNWHVVTGRNPKTPERLLNQYPESPSSFSLHLPRNQSPNHFLPTGIQDFYVNGVPNWIETEIPNSSAEERVDLVALPFEKSDSKDDYLVTTINQFSPTGDECLRIGRRAVIVGYPFGISGSNPYPIWKQGYIASEPSICVDGMPKFYIDSPGRPGMSGSPLFLLSGGKGVSETTAELLSDTSGKSPLEIISELDVDEWAKAPDVNILEFAGVYTGSVGDSRLESLRVGVVWHAGIVDQLFTQPKKGSNPYPPSEFD